MDNKITGLLKKIKKLLTQAEGEANAGNEAASQKFALKAQELLIKYKLDLTDLEQIEEDKANPMSYELITPSLWGDTEQKSRVEYTEDLAATIARAYFCRILAVLENNNLIIVGRQSDIEITKAILSNVMRAGLINCETSLAMAMLKISEIAGAAGHWKRTGGNDEFRYSFFCGFNGRITDRLARQYELIKAQAVTSLALYNADKEVDSFLQSLNPVVDEPLPERAAMMQAAYNKGTDAGEHAQIFPNVFKDDNTKQIGD